jgi:hypothetical protein
MSCRSVVGRRRASTRRTARREKPPRRSACIDNKAGRAEGTVSFAVPSVTQAVAAYEGTFPFPLLSDAKLDAFKAYSVCRFQEPAVTRNVPHRPSRRGAARPRSRRVHAASGCRHDRFPRAAGAQVETAAPRRHQRVCSWSIEAPLAIELNETEQLGRGLLKPLLSPVRANLSPLISRDLSSTTLATVALHGTH